MDTEFDILTMREAIRAAQRFVGAPVWSGYVIRSLSNAISDEDLDQYIRANTQSTLHPVGTASMSPRGAKYGVVDPDLRVKGVNGLRVIDASVLVGVVLLTTNS